VTGIFESSGFGTSGVFQRSQGGDLDAFVAKFSPLGELLFFTYLGGSRDDQGDGIELDSEGNIIVFGQTESSDFPTLNAIYENKKGDFDLFITKLTPDGSSVLFSTYFGGSLDDFNHDGYHGSGLTIDHSNNIIFAATTESSNYPVTNEFQTDMEHKDAVLTKLSADGQSVLFSTYLGGNGEDGGGNVAITSKNEIICVGVTESQDLPTVAALFPEFLGGQDGFIYKFSENGQNLEYCTYFGGLASDQRMRVSIDHDDMIYLSGNTGSVDFPIKNAAQSTKNPNFDAFISKISPDGQEIIFSTFFGGSGPDYGFGIDIDEEGIVYSVGATGSHDLQLESPFQTGFSGGAEDGFIVRFSPDGKLIDYSTYFGGHLTDWIVDIEVLNTSQIVVSGVTYSSSGFPNENAFQSFHWPLQATRPPEDGFLGVLIVPDFVPSNNAGILILGGSFAGISLIAGIGIYFWKRRR
jgi:hypothetical protein